MPRLISRVTLWRTALKVDRECQQTVTPPFRHGGDELLCVPVRIPFSGVRIRPPGNGVRIAIIKYALDHARVQQETLNPAPAPDAPGIRRLTVDMEFLTDNAHRCSANASLLTLLRPARIVRT